MKTAAKVSLFYLSAAACWLAGSDWLFAALFPESAPAMDLFKIWGFIFLSAALLYFFFEHEDGKRSETERYLRDLAIYDPLTGLVNRSYFMAALDRALGRAARERDSVAVAFIDLDGFKAVNDTYGHHVGDRLLIEMGRRIGTVVRAADCAARFGGDEFVVLVDGEGPDGGNRLAERLRRALNAPLIVEGNQLAVTASIGVATYPDCQSGEHLLQAADRAMYRAKATGKKIAMGALSPAA